MKRILKQISKKWITTSEFCLCACVWVFVNGNERLNFICSAKLDNIYIYKNLNTVISTDMRFLFWNGLCEKLSHCYKVHLNSWPEYEMTIIQQWQCELANLKHLDINYRNSNRKEIIIQIEQLRHVQFFC